MRLPCLHRHLGRNDRQKLDEYLTGVREIEKKIEKAETMGAPADPDVTAPDGKPDSFQDDLRLTLI